MDEKDRSHLNLLGIFYYVWAAMSLVAALACLFALVVAAVAILGGSQVSGEMGPEPVFATVLVALILGMVILFTGATAVLEFLAARGLQTRRWRILIYIAAALNCMSVPLGTILGVFTFIVMARPSVSEAFEQNTFVPTQAPAVGSSD